MRRARRRFPQDLWTIHPALPPEPTPSWRLVCGGLLPTGAPCRSRYALVPDLGRVGWLCRTCASVDWIHDFRAALPLLKAEDQAVRVYFERELARIRAALDG